MLHVLLATIGGLAILASIVAKFVGPRAAGVVDDGAARKDAGREPVSASAATGHARRRGRPTSSAPRTRAALARRRVRG